MIAAIPCTVDATPGRVEIALVNAQQARFGQRAREARIEITIWRHGAPIKLEFGARAAEDLILRTWPLVIALRPAPATAVDASSAPAP